MTGHVLDLLPDFVVGELRGAAEEMVVGHLAACDDCAREASGLADAFTEVAMSLPSVAPNPTLRSRVLASIEDAPAARFEPFIDRLAKLLDLAVGKVRELVAAIDTRTPWVAGPCEGTALFHLPAGPLANAKNAGFVRVDAGLEFPFHQHVGAERVLVLQGGCRDSDGSIVRRGDLVEMPAGSEHSFTALPGPDFIYLVVLEGDVLFPGLPGFQV